MTQTASPPAPAPQPAPAGQAPPGRATHASVQPASSGFTENVPRLLNRLQTIAIAACVVFGVLAVVVQVLAWQANGRAAANTEQVVRVQEVQSLLLRADALATNSFLVGGLEPTDARADYDDAVERALRLVADAAEAQPADREVLADLNAAITDYTTAVSQARDYNRQQLPIGIAYLNDAGTSLRTDALPAVDALVDANAERAVDEMDAQHPWWLLGLGILAVAVLLWVNQQVGRRFRRRLNVGLAVAAAIVGVLALGTGAHAFLREGHNESLRDGAYGEAVAAASARTAGNDAKARESQGLINRGAGATYEKNWDEQAAVVDDNTTRSTEGLWGAYVEAHRAIRDLDDAGDWGAAVALATSTEEGSATAALDEFDAATAAVAADQGQQASDGFGSGGAVALVLVALTILGALAAAGAVTRGIDLRRKEYQ
ncbi:hypothetical protein FE634_15125 [Nocardioides dongxiaopingii]|uniref:hypothetical protein n=1 Tax=Nocardioides sp. S-1144 TaxID=2582905 RepID=UPI0011655779|nr:hypothetical protein [Nocardioides sp. S-1144]QCW51403.2 hypothetical protein FE634_15125 [Nocardioides sp. S-1144]